MKPSPSPGGSAKKYDVTDSEPVEYSLDEYVIGSRRSTVTPPPSVPGQCWNDDRRGSADAARRRGGIQQQRSNLHRRAHSNRRIEALREDPPPVSPTSPSTLPLHPQSGLGSGGGCDGGGSFVASPTPSKRASVCFCLIVSVLVAAAVATLSYFLALFTSSGGDDASVTTAAGGGSIVAASYNVTIAAQFSPFAAAAAETMETEPEAARVEDAMKAAVAEAFDTRLDNVDIFERRYMAFASLALLGVSDADLPLNFKAR